MTPVFAAVCPECGSGLRLRRRRRDDHQFIGCSGWPECSFACDVVPPADPIREELGDALRRLVARWHPDRCRELTPHEVVAELNGLRDWLVAYGELEATA